MDDVIIIGGSAAATSAGIYLSRRGMKFKIVSVDFGGEVAVSGEIGNYPGFSATDGISLTEKFKEHLAAYKVAPEREKRVVAVRKLGEGHFEVEAESINGGEKIKYEARTVIVASGSKPRELNVPGEKEFRGKGLSYCTVCDGPLFVGKNVAIVGGGDSANEAGIMMNEIAAKVYVLTKNPDMKGDPSLIARLKASSKVEIIPNAITLKINGDKFVNGMEYKDVLTNETKNLGVEGIFIHVGMIPNSDFLPQEISKNKTGEIIIDKNGATSIPGIFAAGDVTETAFKQIGIAVGQGIIAALSAVSYVNRLPASTPARHASQGEAGGSSRDVGHGLPA